MGAEVVLVRREEPEEVRMVLAARDSDQAKGSLVGRKTIARLAIQKGEEALENLAVRMAVDGLVNLRAAKLEIASRVIGLLMSLGFRNCGWVSLSGTGG